MSPDDKPKVAIPVWQRAVPTRPAQDDPVSSQPDAQADAEPTPSASNTGEEPTEVEVQESTALKAPAAQQAHVSTTFQTSDFEAFQQRQQQQQQPPPPPPPPARQGLSQPPLQPQQRPIAPPIITYPEFLVDAHKPPPLITPTAVLNSLYIASGVAAAFYGASKLLVAPMIESLTASRHDFITHSQSKMEEFNERLSKIVGKVPEPRKGAGSFNEEDAESETSDPTELYHRDMGTQTSPPPTRAPSPTTPATEKHTDTFQLQGLAVMCGHLEQLVKGSERAGESQKERQESMNNLKQYLDQLQYTNSGINVWAGNDDVSTTPRDDAVEELKKEIRGVKGVLLSAKRFPALSRTVPGTS